MDDDLATELRLTTELMANFASVPSFELWNRHSNACLEAATRLSALGQPAGADAVEAVARPTSLRALVDSLITFGRSHDGAVERDLYAAVERAEAALAAHPGGAEMREAAAICDAQAVELDGHGRPKEADGARWCARHIRAASLKAIPLSPEEEGRT